jgi:hypothetical protein
MNRKTITAGAVALLAIIFLGLQPAFGAVVTFRGRMYSAVAGAPAYLVKIEISEFTSPDEALKLVGFMSRGDDSGFYSMLRGLNRGNMQFIGSQGLNIKFNVVQEYQTEKGIRIVLMTEGRSVEPGTSKFLNVPWRFLVVFLDLDKNYNGAGRIYEDAAIGATSNGNITMSSSYTISKELISIRLVK